jgi:hypothetical protein
MDQEDWKYFIKMNGALFVVLDLRINLHKLHVLLWDLLMERFMIIVAKIFKVAIIVVIKINKLLSHKLVVKDLKMS